MNYEELYTLAAQVEERLQPVFRGFERTAEKLSLIHISEPTRPY